jgi:hypothetical protein
MHNLIVFFRDFLESVIYIYRYKDWLFFAKTVFI